MIPPISGLSSLTPPSPPAAAAPATNADPLVGSSGAADSTGGSSFSNAVTNAIDSLQSAQANASSLEASSAAGQGNLADTMIAATQASLDTEVTTSLLDKATTSYNSIMNMTF